MTPPGRAARPRGDLGQHFAEINEAALVRHSMRNDMVDRADRQALVHLLEEELDRLDRPAEFVES